MENSTIKNDIK